MSDLSDEPSSSQKAMNAASSNFPKPGISIEEEGAFDFTKSTKARKPSESHDRPVILDTPPDAPPDAPPDSALEAASDTSFAVSGHDRLSYSSFELKDTPTVVRLNAAPGRAVPRLDNSANSANSANLGNPAAPQKTLQPLDPATRLSTSLSLIDVYAEASDTEAEAEAEAETEPAESHFTAETSEHAETAPAEEIGETSMEADETSIEISVKDGATVLSHNSQIQPPPNGTAPSAPSATPPALRTDTQPPDRDRYGFRKKTALISEAQYNQWWASYAPYAQRRKRKWTRLMARYGLPTSDPIRFPPKSEKLKRYIRKGIPAEWRGHAWFWFAHGYERLNANIGVYDGLAASPSRAKPLDRELIERDLHRTFPDNIYFRADYTGQLGTQKGNGKLSSASASASTEPAMIQALRRVLLAFSVYRPAVGYCQSLNFLAGLLLLFLDEEKAFWMLVIITEKYLPGVHDMDLEGVSVDQGVLMLCLRDLLPKTWATIRRADDSHSGGGVSGVSGVNNGKTRGIRGSAAARGDDSFLVRLPPLMLCTASWFMSAYIGVLPIETTLRVWDVFFYEGSKTIFRVAVTIFSQCTPEMQKFTDPMEMFQLVQNHPKTLLDVNAFFRECFFRSGRLRRNRGWKNISQVEIDKCRQYVQEKRREYRKQGNSLPSVQSSFVLSGLSDTPTRLPRLMTLRKREKAKA